MANAVTNVVYANPNVIKFMLNVNGLVDFNKVIPIPQCLLDPGYDQVTNDVYDIADSLKRHLSPSSTKEELLGIYHKAVTELNEEDKAKLGILIDLMLKCGYYYDKDFKSDNWGTNCNAYHQEPYYFTENMVFFDTNWRTPISVYVELSKKFPEETITVEYADEDTGYNCGKFTVLNGMVTEVDIGNSIEFAKATQRKSSHWVKALNKVRYSGNGHVLTVTGEESGFDIISLELHGTWKDIWVVKSDDSVHNASTYLYPYYQEVERKLKNNDESMFLDGAVNPKALKLLSELSGVHLCYTAYEMAVGRWEINDVNTEYDYE